MAKAIVIGGGFGGIAAALRLRRKGYDVTLIDKQDKLGGRGYQYRRETPLGTFIHDAGPTVITAKFLFDELFEMFGKKREDYVEFRDIYPWYRIIFAGEITGKHVGATHGSSAIANRPADDACVAPTELPFFDYGGTMEQFEAQIAKFEPRDVEGFRKYLAHSKKIFDVGFTKLGDQPFDKFTTMLKCAPALMRLQNYKTVYGMAKQYIRSEKLRRVFSFQPLLVGGNPFNTTSIYSLIFYLERQWGIQFAMGGTGAIVRALEKLMREEGIEILLGHEAKLHVHRAFRTTRYIESPFKGPFVDTDEEDDAPMTPEERAQMHRDTEAALKHLDETLKATKEVPAVTRVSTDAGFDVQINKIANGRDLVVMNADAAYVYEKMIKPEFRIGLAPRRLNRKSQIANLKFSMGLFVLYFGTTKMYDNIPHHTIVLGDAYKELIDSLFDHSKIETEDLSVYLHRPTATDPSMAPAGCESFYCLVPVPNLQMKLDWAEWGPKMRDATVRYLEKTCLPGLSECIVDDFYVTPEHFRDNLNSMHGAGFSIQPIFSQSAYFRFHNKAPGIEGLYFVGAGTHPGAGMPGVLCSAKVLEHLIPDVTPTAAPAV
ncbi:MAG TPA: phytoene desaturase family protein [Tepidisphaeraceae bacterium]|jgi:phytoene desaturase